VKVTPDIIRYELIGTHAKVARSPHGNYVGLKGRVVDETKNTFLLRCRNEMKRVIKENAVFHFRFEDGTVVEVDGALLVGQPEGRLKKTIRRLW
jgi:ribonuclease P protein subunit POP4